MVEPASSGKAATKRRSLVAGLTALSASALAAANDAAQAAQARAAQWSTQSFRAISGNKRLRGAGRHPTRRRRHRPAAPAPGARPWRGMRAAARGSRLALFVS